ncbi:MAG: hypothetical protein AN484_28060, partial [Aphanizomenon flos-aquae WA102]
QGEGGGGLRDCCIHLVFTVHTSTDKQSRDWAGGLGTVVYRDIYISRLASSPLAWDLAGDGTHPLLALHPLPPPQKTCAAHGNWSTNLQMYTV